MRGTLSNITRLYNTEIFISFYFIFAVTYELYPAIPNLGPIRTRSRVECRKKRQALHRLPSKPSPSPPPAVTTTRRRAQRICPVASHKTGPTQKKRPALQCASLILFRVPHVRIVTPPHPRFRGPRGCRSTRAQLRHPFYDIVAASQRNASHNLSPFLFPHRPELLLN